MENLLRLGYLMRGLVYGVIGLMALLVVIGGGGALTDTQGAIAIWADGRRGILLYAVLVGLASYGLWGLVRAAADPMHKGTDTKGIAERVGYAISGFPTCYWHWPLMA